MTEHERRGEGRVPERGRAGGYAAAAEMAGITTMERVRWGAIWSGLLVAIATQMILSAFGVAIGLYQISARAGAAVNINWSAVGLWNAIWGLIALFLGGFVAARLAAATTSTIGAWHGVIVWALVLVLGTLLTAMGITGVMGFLPTRMMAIQGISPSDVLGTAWAFFIGSLLGLGAAAWGGSVGRRRETTAP